MGVFLSHNFDFSLCNGVGGIESWLTRNCKGNCCICHIQLVFLLCSQFCSLFCIGFDSRTATLFETNSTSRGWFWSPWPLQHSTITTHTLQIPINTVHIKSTMDLCTTNVMDFLQMAFMNWVASSKNCAIFYRWFQCYLLCVVHYLTTGVW